MSKTSMDQVQYLQLQSLVIAHSPFDGFRSLKGFFSETKLRIALNQNFSFNFFLRFF